jgi:hypothetical protein
MAQHTITNITRDEIIEQLKEVVSVNDHNFWEEAGTFDIDAAADAILAGQVQPDWNNDDDGIRRIDDEVMALAFGAFMSSGPWWRVTDPQTWVRFDPGAAEWVSCVIDPADPAWTVCGRAVGADERATIPDGWIPFGCSDCDA